MPNRILLTNDDGVDSPALMEFATALEKLGEVTVVAPARERSWVGKAITRLDPLTMKEVIRSGTIVHAVDGFPADCTQLGIGLFGEQPPDLVVSGINVGYNHGEAFMLSSGTVGAAFEAAIRQIPAVAVSAGTSGDWTAWHAAAWSGRSNPMWTRLAALATGIIEPILRLGFPSGADVININIPEDADDGTERRVTRIAPSRYDSVLAPDGAGGYVHVVTGHRVEGDVAGTDIEASAHGVISITPIRLPGSGDIFPELMDEWGAVDRES